ncbi:MAG TPA: endonuclease MutS2 [Chthonomonadaceae bacterium]|nr:endonuclease MutS2 [Chthonomonadaceae bacterium]
MDAHSLQLLEYRKVIDRLSAHTSCALGREFAAQLEPLPYPETVTRRLQETAEARKLRDNDSGLPLGGIRDIRETAERARIGTRLSPHELLDAMHTIAAARRMRVYLTSRSEGYPLLGEMAANLPVLQLAETRIETSIAESAEVKDGASAELGRLRSQIKIAQSRLNDRLQGILASDKYRTMIQEFVVTVREGRYCIPVKAEYARPFGGLVHDSSQSGATVFIEPAQVVELGNELKQLTIREEQEVGRILGELSGLVGSYYDELQRVISILGHLDVIHAKAVLAEEMGAEEPRLNRRGIVRLVNARHPLLPGAVVPIDIEVGERFTTLLITGPNTGGKTVTLKTLGLLTLMTLAGLQIPASPESEIALFDQIFADIGDEQDIQQSLSTFSAHLKNIVRIVETIGGNALVLMDEVGAGTDPAEGAAIAKALFDHLMARGARVIATTHYGELKEYAYARPGVENASVEFDRETLSPTYRVLLGVPGSSNAFYIASRLGLPKEIVDEARSFLSHREIETGELLQQIEASRKRARQAEGEAFRARNEAQKARDEYQTRAKQISDVQRTVRQQAQEEARDVIRRATVKAENILKELQKMHLGARKGPSVRQRLNTLRKDTYESLAPEEAEQAPPEPVDPTHVYRANDTVRVISLNREGVLLEAPRDGVVPVQIGAMRVTLPLEQIRPLNRAEASEAAKRTSRRTAAATSGASEIAMQKAAHIAPELMLRAMRVEEAQPLLDKYMDDAAAAGIGQVRIIHGKGTGALRRAVWEFLSGHPSVDSFRIGEGSEGGEGATVVRMRT